MWVVLQRMVGNGADVSPSHRWWHIRVCLMRCRLEFHRVLRSMNILWMNINGWNTILSTCVDEMDWVVLVGYGMAHWSSSVVVVLMIGSSPSFPFNEHLMDECRWIDFDSKHLLRSHGMASVELALDEKWEKWAVWSKNGWNPVDVSSPPRLSSSGSEFRWASNSTNDIVDECVWMKSCYAKWTYLKMVWMTWGYHCVVSIRIFNGCG